ncbi:putative ubiquitin carboxyl-terminal hydrolase FAF-X [Ixodes scapularis]
MDRVIRGNASSTIEQRNNGRLEQQSNRQIPKQILDAVCEQEREQAEPAGPPCGGEGGPMTLVTRANPLGGGDPPPEQPPPSPHAPAPSEEAPSEEPEFPLAELARLDEMINRPRWVVPVLAKGELEVLLEAAIALCKEGRDVASEPCQRFFREGLTISFTKILTDEAVSGWKFEIHRCIMRNCERLVELCVTKLQQDWFPLLDLLAMVLNPHNKFHSYNGSRPSDSVPPGSQIPDEEVFARPTDTRTPKGWLVDLINRFGSLGGFSLLLERFRSGRALSVPLMAALIRPLGLCHSLLTVSTVERFLLPLVSLVPSLLERLTDDELKREAKNETKNDALSAIVKALRCLAARVPHQEDTVKALEMFRLRMILSRASAIQRVEPYVFIHQSTQVLQLLWSLAHSREVPTDMMELALSFHVKILDYSCSQERDAQKSHWLDRCVQELREGPEWALPALRHIQEVAGLYSEAPLGPAPAGGPHRAAPAPVGQALYRHEVINRLQQQHSLVVLVADGLSAYMARAKRLAAEHPDLDPNTVYADSRYSHVQQVQERLKFLRFLLKDGQLWLCAAQAKQIWNCLAENAVYSTDREACFKWFSKLMGEEPDLDPEINQDFFENNVLQLEPSVLTENGIKCFERFFKAVNSKEGKLVVKRRVYQLEDVELVGADYLWKVVLHGASPVADRAIELLREVYTSLGPRLQGSQVEMHEDFIQSCLDRLKAAYDTLCVLEQEQGPREALQESATRMVRVLRVLSEYVAQCDGDYAGDRTLLPMARAHRGKHLGLTVRFPSQGRQLEDLELWVHTNDTLGSIRRQILSKVKVNNINMKIDLFINAELLDPADDKKLVSQLPIKDRMVLSAKLCQLGSQVPSSPESSSDSSVGSPQHQYEGPRPDAEACLPGVLMSRQPRYTQFLFKLADLGSSLQVPQLREGAMALLKILPADVQTVEKLRQHCSHQPGTTTPSLDSLLRSLSPTELLYHLEVVYALLLPAQNPCSEEAQQFQCGFVQSGGVPLVLGMLTQERFLSGLDPSSRRSGQLLLLKLSKLLLTTVGQCLSLGAPDAASAGGWAEESPQGRSALLQQALTHIPNPGPECMLRSVAQRLAQLLRHGGATYLPELSTVRALIQLAWAASGKAPGSQVVPPKEEQLELCQEALEVLTLALALQPEALDTLMLETQPWAQFVLDMLLMCPNRSIRQCAADQLCLVATQCYPGHGCLVFMVELLFAQLPELEHHASQCQELFGLLCALLSCACSSRCTLAAAEQLLNDEVLWLKKVREQVQEAGALLVPEPLLEGHLGVARELVSLLGPQAKQHVGLDTTRGLVQELLEDFAFPSSRVEAQLRRRRCSGGAGDVCGRPAAVAVCGGPRALAAALDLVVALCTQSLANLATAVRLLKDMFYAEGQGPLHDWDYLPPVGPRPQGGFVGLKNAGATCYMNSVLQQLYMIESIREGLLAVEGAALDPNEDFSGDPEGGAPEAELCVGPQEEGGREEQRRDYNLGVLKQVQAVFGHLACSQLQYYVPRGFWKHFKLWGEPVNLREQHDALEFFNSLVDSLDEALKTLGQPCILAKVLGGTFADQKICKGCPHRYSREESFTTLNIDIRNHSNLSDSLEQYVKGDLLEGANAYHCDKCNKKVDTVKRLCIKKLPPILAIQLKRFDYDWERECAIKFNDYFEFPRELDMEPYTVQGLAKMEGEVIEEEPLAEDLGSTRYQLTGIVVHSGQASGGHYYSYILYRHGESPQWYKFDDGEVSECRMEEEEEMKNQCFGGEYMGEVFDHMLKRMSYRRQKRWWNAYILFYQRAQEAPSLQQGLQDLSLEPRPPDCLRMPLAIERSVWRQNIKFMHNRNQFSIEYFQFMKKLISCNAPYVNPPTGHDKLLPEAEELAMLSTQLAARFLFLTALHTKKTLRGPAADWCEVVCVHLRHSRAVRLWFATEVLFGHSHRLAEYLLECPNAEVRSAFAKMVVFLAHASLQDGPYSPPAPFASSCSLLLEGSGTLSDHLLLAVLSLVNKEVSEHGRHLAQYFGFFYMYACFGVPERLQLLRLNVLSTLMLVALDEGPGPPIKYQYADLSKLYQLVSLLVRCCDVSSKTHSCLPNSAPLPNPHAGDQLCPDYLMVVQPQVAACLFNKTSYVKKVIEDANGSEDTAKLLRFCSWENPQFSSTVLSELLWQIAYTYTYELRPFMDLLLHVLLLEDSWQNHRIHNALKGIPDDREGLFDTIQRSKNHYQKRAYQCIKCLVALFGSCPAAAHMLHTNGELKRKWTASVDWLHDELERRPYAGSSQYGYNQWSPPAQSNETSNGYFLERSHSARLTLSRAIQLCPEEEPEEQEDDGEIPLGVAQQAQQCTTAQSSFAPTQQQQQRADPSPGSSLPGTSSSAPEPRRPSLEDGAT